jgi:hypothetical protein
MLSAGTLNVGIIGLVGVVGVVGEPPPGVVVVGGEPPVPSVQRHSRTYQ